MSIEIYVSVVMWDGCVDEIAAFKESEKAESWLRDRIANSGVTPVSADKLLDLKTFLKTLEDSHHEGSNIYCLDLY